MTELDDELQVDERLKLDYTTFFNMLPHILYHPDISCYERFPPSNSVGERALSDGLTAIAREFSDRCLIWVVGVRA